MHIELKLSARELKLNDSLFTNNWAGISQHLYGGSLQQFQNM
jgi:hypothetical protein